jgi:dUTP pyrophosphatase
VVATAHRDFVAKLRALTRFIGPPVLEFEFTTENAFAPVKGTPGSAGFDLKASESCTIPPRSRISVNTDLKVCLPNYCYGMIKSRSGLSLKNGIEVGAGIIDSDYRGILKVILYNHSDVNIVVLRGDRIAQFLCQPLARVVCRVTNPLQIAAPELNVVQPLRVIRGEHGFGSTG